jgi:hypothetical protein
MNTCQCVSPSPCLTIALHAYIEEGGQATLKFDARGRELAAQVNTRDECCGAEKASWGSQTS